jgi:hypothetical protein
METGLHGPEGDPKAIGDLGHRQLQVVVEDEHGALLERQPPEGTLHLVAVGDRLEAVGAGPGGVRTVMAVTQRRRRLASE